MKAIHQLKNIASTAPISAVPIFTNLSNGDIPSCQLNLIKVNNNTNLCFDVDFAKTSSKYFSKQSILAILNFLTNNKTVLRNRDKFQVLSKIQKSIVYTLGANQYILPLVSLKKASEIDQNNHIYPSKQQINEFFLTSFQRSIRTYTYESNIINNSSKDFRDLTYMLYCLAQLNYLNENFLGDILPNLYGILPEIENLNPSNKEFVILNLLQAFQKKQNMPSPLSTPLLYYLECFLNNKTHFFDVQILVNFLVGIAAIPANNNNNILTNNIISNLILNHLKGKSLGFENLCRVLNSLTMILSTRNSYDIFPIYEDIIKFCINNLLNNLFSYRLLPPAHSYTLCSLAISFSTLKSSMERKNLIGIDWTNTQSSLLSFISIVGQRSLPQLNPSNYCDLVEFVAKNNPSDTPFLTKALMHFPRVVQTFKKRHSIQILQVLAYEKKELRKVYNIQKLEKYQKNQPWLDILVPVIATQIAFFHSQELFTVQRTLKELLQPQNYYHTPTLNFADSVKLRYSHSGTQCKVGQVGALLFMIGNKKVKRKKKRQFNKPK